LRRDNVMNEKTCGTSMGYKREYDRLLESYLKLIDSEIMYRDTIQNLATLLNKKDKGETNKYQR